MYPGVLLNGTMGAFMAIILFVNFQSQMVEVDAIARLETGVPFCWNWRCSWRPGSRCR